MTILEQKIDAIVDILTARSAEERVEAEERLLALKHKRIPDVETVEDRISQYLHLFGIPEHISGTQYLKEIIPYCLNYGKVMPSITKELYPMVAEVFGTTRQRVERAIRTAIEVGWDRIPPDIIEHYFGNSVSPDHGKPTNAEFIWLLVDRIRRDMNAA